MMYRLNAKPHHVDLFKRWGFTVTTFYPSDGSMLLKLDVPKGKVIIPEQAALLVTIP